MRRIACFLLICLPGLSLHSTAQHTLWQIGQPDTSSSEFALAPNQFRQFVGKDFGYEDKYFLVGYSKEKEHFPYVLPGPVDTWGGTWSTSGWRTNQINILFGLQNTPPKGTYTLTIKLTDFAKKFLPLMKVIINDQEHLIQLSSPGHDVKKQPAPRLNEPFVDTASITGNLSAATPETIEIPVSHNTMRKGGNQVTITILQGSWVLFDAVSLTGAKVDLVKPSKAFIRQVMPASYTLNMAGVTVQPLLVHAEHLSGQPQLKVELDGKRIFQQTVEEGTYVWEAPMPAVTTTKSSRYKVYIDGKVVDEGIITRSPQKRQTPADYVDTRIGTAHSRWMIAPGPWMPFSMVKLSPDNQNKGWQAGYEPAFESIGTFSYIHEWTMAGLGIFPTNGALKTKVGDQLGHDDGYRSAFDKKSEEAPIGYYKVLLKDYAIKAEATATTRCGLQRFTFPADRDSSRILVDFHIPAEYDYQLKKVMVRKTGPNRLEGFSHQFSPGVWSHDASQDYTVHFVIEFDQPIARTGTWVNDAVAYGDVLEVSDVKDAGLFLEFDTKKNPVVQVRAGISLVSIANAKENLATEITRPFNWDFEAVRKNQQQAWNDLLSRVIITTSNRLEKIRFYNALYRSICSRNIWSDVNGQWRGTDGAIQQLKNKDDVALGCDAFWNTFWNLNQFWNLVTPEWSSKWVKSQLAMYDAYGWLAKGPAGMNYIPVMVAEHEIPMMVSAWQMGIRDFDAKKVLEAAVKMQTTPAQKVFNGFAGNRDLTAYLQHQYVPADKGRFSNTMEYSYDDWCVGQLAKSLGDSSLYKTYNERGYWWKHAIDKDGYCHLKMSNGEWSKDFDPFRSGANHHYVEGNAWQLSFFVPQDVPALTHLIGKEEFVKRLEWGFQQSEPWRYNGMNDQYWDYPVVHGNQQSMHFAFLFNWAGKPWLTQQWSRSVLDRYYGCGIGNAYPGDEDQGQMSGWFVMAAIGLFQTDGGCRSAPVYEIGSPLYERIEINLGKKYGRGDQFVIVARNASRHNKYVQQATLNGKPLTSFYFPASELLKGGELVLEMGPAPNTNWGVQ